MTSGDMYMGVPVMDFCLPGTRPAPASWGWRVLPWRAMILAAPKSTNLMTPLWSRRMSVGETGSVIDVGWIQILG